MTKVWIYINIECGIMDNLWKSLRGTLHFSGRDWKCGFWLDFSVERDCKIHACRNHPPMTITDYLWIMYMRLGILGTTTTATPTLIAAWFHLCCSELRYFFRITTKKGKNQIYACWFLGKWCSRCRSWHGKVFATIHIFLCPHCGHACFLWMDEEDTGLWPVLWDV